MSAAAEASQPVNESEAQADAADMEVEQAPNVDTKESSAEVPHGDVVANQDSTEGSAACEANREETEATLPGADLPENTVSEEKQDVPMPDTSEVDTCADKGSTEGDSACEVEKQGDVEKVDDTEAVETAPVEAAQDVTMDAAAEAEEEPTEGQAESEVQVSEEREQNSDQREADKQLVPVPAEASADSDAKPSDVDLKVDTQAAPSIVFVDGEPQKPRKGGTAYSLFCGSVRDEVLKELDDGKGGKPKLGDIAKAIGVRWNALTEERKTFWKDHVAADKERYEAEMKLYQEAIDPVGTLQAKFEHLIPKKPLSFFGLFLQDPAKRAKAATSLLLEGKQQDKKHLMAKLGEMWRSASQDEKNIFQERAQKLQAEFDEKQKAWEALPEYEELSKATMIHLERKIKREEAERLERNIKEQEAAAKEQAAAAKREAKKPPTKSKDSTPTKRASAGAESTPPDAKKPRTSAAKAAEPELDQEILVEATKLGWEASFRNLAVRAEVIASGKPATAILDALRASNGLVNPAKRALLEC